MTRNRRLTERQTRENVQRSAGHEQPGRSEELERNVIPCEDRRRDELAAHEAENVAVARIAGGDPRAVVTGDSPDERKQILRQPEDPSPAVRDRRQVAEQFDEERVQRVLDRLGRRLVVCHLREDGEVAEAAEDDASVRELLPVVEPVTRVVRTLEKPFAQRLGRDHLAERGQEAAPRSVGGDDDLLGVELAERADSLVLPERDTLRGSLLGKTTDEPPRLQRAVRRMEDRAPELWTQMWQLVAPLRSESVLAQGFVLQANLASLLVVGRKAKASCSSKRISGDRFEPVE